MRWGLLHGAVLAVAAACQGGGYFVCNDDDDCAGQGEAVCQPTGACSFPDDECPSGQRYGESSQPSLAGECVAAGDGSTGEPEDPSTTSGTPADSSSDAPPPDVTGEACPPDWWDCAWAHRQRLSLRAGIGEPLAEVPVLVLLVAGRVDHELMQADGEDLRFVSSAGSELPYEIERWDPTGVSTIWVGVDVLEGAGEHVWLYYGNPVAEGAEDPAGVWPEPYVGVWHLEGDPLDSTAHAHHATSSGSTAIAEGHIANGRNIIGTSGRLDVETTDSLVDLFAGGATVSAWIRARSFGGSGYGRIVDKEDGAAETGWLFYAASGGLLRFHTWFVGGNVMWETPGETIELHRWVHVAVTFDALGPALPRVFVDGEEVPLDDPPEVPVEGELPTDVEVPLAFGNRAANDRRFDGILDEIRMERTLRSLEWIRVQHDSMRDALFEYGPIESWGGGA
jgi:biopolymer transport protein ExbB